jgi:uncharacterized protein
MGLPRLIMLGIIIGLGVWLWRRFNSRPISSRKPSIVQTMVCCANCHVHLPENRAIQNKQHWYCSPAHLQQGPKARD